MSWLRFVENGTSPSGKTKKWRVENTSAKSEVLGDVAWFSHWRQYCFYTALGTVWNADCLLEIQEFLDAENRAHADRRGKEE